MAGIDNNTLLYLRGDSFKDLGPKGKAITSTGCTLDSSTKSINATSGHIYTTYTSDFAPNATSLTVEAWFKMNSGGSTFTICFGGQTGYYFGDIELNTGSTSSSTNLVLSNLNNASGTQSNTTSTFTGVSEAVPVGVWTHICITYDLSSKVLVMYINGQATRRYTNLTINYRGANYGVGFGYRKSNNQFLNGYIKNARISNVVRYTGNFTPQSDPFTSVSVNNLNLSNNQLTFGVTKLSANETINKVDIVVNNKVIQTITSNYDSISYTIDESAYSYGDNVIEARAYYFDNYYASASVTHRKELILEEFEPIPSLPDTASFDDIITHLNRIKFANESMLNNLKTLLEDKGLQAGENPRLSTLIMTVKELSNNNDADVNEYINRITALENEKSALAQSNATLNSQVTNLNSTISSNTTLLYNKLVAKGITGISTSSTFSALVSSIDKFTSIPTKVYLYNAGDECTSITGGWKGHQFDSSFKNGFYTKGTSYLEYGDKTSNYGYGGFITTKAIDLTKYSKLVVKHQIASTSYTSGYNSHAKVSLCTVAAPTIRTNGHLIDLTTINGSSGNRAATETVIDISSRTGSYYIGVRGESGSFNNDMITARLHYIYLTN